MVNCDNVGEWRKRGDLGKTRADLVTRYERSLVTSSSRPLDVTTGLQAGGMLKFIYSRDVSCMRSLDRIYRLKPGANRN